MTVSVSNTNLNDSFNTWRLNTNFAATVISNNVVTVARAGSANRGGVAKGNGHVAGTFTANELRTTTLKSGNTSDEGGWLYVNSNTSINATSLTVTANTTFQGNVDFVTSGGDRLVLGDISRVRVTGGTQGQFLRIDGNADTPNFKSLSLRDIADLSTNSAPIILSASNTTFSDNGDTPAIVFAANNGTDKVNIFLASNTTAATSSDLIVQLADTVANASLSITNSSNTEQVAIRADGTVFAVANVTATGFTTDGNILPIADDSVDIGSPNREFRNAYFDGTVTTDVLTVATGGSQGVSASLIPVTDAAGNLGSTTRKWGTVWADNTNGGAGVFSSVGISGSLTVNGDVTLNSDNFTLDGNTVVGDASTDTVTFNAQVDSDFDPQTGSQRDMGATNNRWHNIYANNIFANNVTTDNNVTINGDLSVSGTTQLASGQTFSSPIGRFTNAHVVTLFESFGTTVIGDNASDTLTITASVTSNIIPDVDDGTGHYTLGTTGSRWNQVFANTVQANNLTTDNLLTVNGDRATISGNVHVGDTVFTTNGIKDGATTIIGKNNKLHANNTITAKTITTTMIANTMTSGGNFGSATQVPIFQVNDRGQVTGIREANTASVSAFGYTQSNNTIRLATNNGTVYTDVIDAATTTQTTGRGVASFDSGDFSVSSGHVTLANGLNGAVLAISGTSNEVNVSRSNGTVTVGLPDDVTVAGQLNVGENIIVAGNLVVQGTTTTVNSETVNIADNIIVLNSNETGTPSQNGGFTIKRGTSTNYSFLWDESNDRWTLGDRNLVANTFIGNVTGNVTGDVTGNAGTATALATARSIGISISGDITASGSANFDGSGNITITASNATYNNDVVLGTDTSGNYVSSLVAGSLIDLQNNTGEGATPTIDVDLSELTDMTAGMLGTDEFVVLDSSAQRRKAANEIDLSIFSNATSGFLSGTDLRGDGVNQIGLDTNDYYLIASTQHRWFLDGAEDMRLTNNGQLDVEGNIVAHSSTVSDINLKENIEKVTDAISKVQQLNGYTFNYKKDGRASAGIIAQEVEEVLPSAVQRTEILGHEGEHLIVEYDQLTALLIESIKELKAEIDDLKKNK